LFSEVFVVSKFFTHLYHLIKVLQQKLHISVQKQFIPSDPMDVIRILWFSALFLIVHLAAQVLNESHFGICYHITIHDILLPMYHSRKLLMATLLEMVFTRCYWRYFINKFLLWISCYSSL